MKRLFIFIMGVMMAVVATSRTFDMKQLGADAKGIKPCTKLINPVSYTHLTLPTNSRV